MMKDTTVVKQTTILKNDIQFPEILCASCQQRLNTSFYRNKIYVDRCEHCTMEPITYAPTFPIHADEWDEAMFRSITIRSNRL